LANLLSLPQLPTRKRQGKEPLVDYYNSYAVTSNQYLVVLKQKVVDKKVVDVENKGKGGKEKKKAKGTLT
jgi:hypothetical protein